MKKKWVITIIIALAFIVVLPDVRHDYKRDAGSVKLDTGRIATIKLKSGHIRMYYNDVDTGYFAEAPECPLCNKEVNTTRN
jgi:hypothetical protein